MDFARGSTAVAPAHVGIELHPVDPAKKQCDASNQQLEPRKMAKPASHPKTVVAVQAGNAVVAVPATVVETFVVAVEALSPEATMRRLLLLETRSWRNSLSCSSSDLCRNAKSSHPAPSRRTADNSPQHDLSPSRHVPMWTPMRSLPWATDVSTKHPSFLP